MAKEAKLDTSVGVGLTMRGEQQSSGTEEVSEGEKETRNRQK